MDGSTARDCRRARMRRVAARIPRMGADLCRTLRSGGRIQDRRADQWLRCGRNGRGTRFAWGSRQIDPSLRADRLDACGRITAPVHPRTRRLAPPFARTGGAGACRLHRQWRGKHATAERSNPRGGSVRADPVTRTAVARGLHPSSVRSGLPVHGACPSPSRHDQRQELRIHGHRQTGAGLPRGRQHSGEVAGRSRHDAASETSQRPNPRSGNCSPPTMRTSRRIGR